MMFNNILRFLQFGFLTKVLCFFFYFQCCCSKPVDEPRSLYSLFIKEMTDKNCTLPKEVQLPTTSPSNTIEDFSSSLYICQKVEYAKFNKEAPVLCGEIFGLLKNISCLPKSIALPEIKIALSSDICKDFALNKAVLPDGLMKHLSDKFNCNLMCSGEFEPPCQVLMWSFLVQQMISSNIEKAKILGAIPNTSLIETKQEQSETPVIKELTESKSTQPVQADQTINTVPIQTTDKRVEPLEQSKPVEQNIPHIASNHQETNELKDNNQVTDLQDTTKVSNAIEKEQPEEPTKFEDNKFVIPDPEGNTQIEDVHSNTDDTDGVPDTGIQQGENDLGSDTQQGQIVPDSLNLLTDAKDKQTSATQKIILEKGGQEKEPSEKQHTSTSDNGSQTVAQLKTLPGFKAGYGINMLQENQSASTKKNEVSSTMITEVQKTATEASLDGKNPVSDDAISAVVSDNPSPTPIIHALPTAPLEKMEDDVPLPDGKDLDHYNDLDNNDGDIDGEYNKQDYDGTVYESTKNKDSNPGTPSITPKEQIVDQKDDAKGFSGYPSRDTFGRGSDEIQVIASFPEQEDSHFFFYFLSIVLILMAGYLLFHNKQKIIALIVEGRHERRRRSHGLGYKKLETK